MVPHETPADQMDRAIVNLQEIEKRLLHGAMPEPQDGADGTVIQDSRDEKLRA